MIGVTKFIEVQEEFIREFFGNKPPQDAGEFSDMTIIFYRLVIEYAQKEIDELVAFKVDFLRQLPYQEYLQSDHWKGIRKMMLDHADYRCQLCNASNRTLHVHHRTYENRGRETVKDLIVLCDQCHSQFHDKLELAK